MNSITVTTISTDELKLIVQDSVRQALHEINQLVPPASLESDQPLTIKEAAKLLKLAVSTVYGLKGKGAIPYYKKGKRLYFSRADLVAWIESGKGKSAYEIQQEANTYISKKRKG